MIRILFIMIVFFLSACENKYVTLVNSRYGQAYNQISLTKGIPKVDNDMSLIEDIEQKRYVYSNHMRIDSIKKPEHIRKILSLDSALNITFEEDYFYNPLQKTYLVFN